MKVIGITGGVGSGKTEVLNLIDGMTKCVIIRADELAKSLEVRGEVCFDPLIELLGEGVLQENGEIDPKKMAQMIFAEESGNLRDKVNGIIHPAVKKRILSMIKEADNEKKVEFFFIEAALLIEDHYDLIVDELWYIYADENVRRQRLRDSRGYSDEKIEGIMASQSSDEVF
ncbi:MAG: dephospho-CoA kinase, partial [Lachnospiraceae bacterium]|nr:dephospho-CoA kinase [Lachnospiraceae bacterium]